MGQVAATWNCSYCGALNKLNDEFCRMCSGRKGALVNDYSPPDPYRRPGEVTQTASTGPRIWPTRRAYLYFEQQERERRRAWLQRFALIGGAVLVGVMVAIVILMRV